MINKQFGDCEGPLGFPMNSVAAKELDAALKAVSKEVSDLVSTNIEGNKAPGYCRLSKGTVTEFDEGERSDISFITTEVVDRDKEVVLSSGLDFGTFKKNPVVGYGHNYSNPPVGRAAWWRKVAGDSFAKTGWIAKTEYAKRPNDWVGPWMPDGIWSLVKDGFLPGKSIGMLVQEIKRPEPAEIEKRAELAHARFIITKAMMVEYSVVGVQANQMAVVQSVAKNKGLFTADFLAELGLQFPDLAKSIIDPPSLPSIKDCLTLADVPRLVEQKLKRINISAMIKEDFDALRGRV